MNLRLQLVERKLGWRGWLFPAVLVALSPKCALCVLAYAGAGTVLGLGGPEFCGSQGATHPWWLVLSGLSVVLTASGILVWRHRLRPGSRSFRRQHFQQINVKDQTR